ncbi:MAG: SpoIIE family protein phosphatase [Acetobacteraceae bacterium]|nr:SpoIIE family protein phosphatase [Acetobacteraceae bacterium]
MNEHEEGHEERRDEGRDEGTDTERTLASRAGMPTGPVDGTVVHFLVLDADTGAPRRIAVEATPLVIGRVPPAAIVLEGSAVSRRHCLVDRAGDQVRLTDLGSTNGTFVDGLRIAEPTMLADGAQLRIGPHTLRYERRRREEALAAASLASDIARARGYVNALLPPPITDGPVRVAWTFQPCAALGGDAFGYHRDGDWFCAYILDVSGHGVGAAMHSVSVMNVMRQQALPGTDMRDPAAVLGALNDMFDMDRHHGMYFTMWYGALHLPSRRLAYAAGGHHPAVLHAPDSGRVGKLPGRGAGIGTMPGFAYRAAGVELPAGARLHLFSDGAVELAEDVAEPWGMAQVAESLCAPGHWADGPERLYRRVRALSRMRPLDDDFSVLTVQLD